MKLSANNLAIGYRGAQIGADISLVIESGQITCLLGPNGCGKTTLFRTLLGLLPPLAGHVLLDGCNITTLSRSEIARHIAYVPQGHTPPFPFEVLDVVLMGRTARMGRFAQPGAQDREAAMKALARLGIADLAQRDYTLVSGGQRQLVLVARALAQEASLIVMDEPTASLDFGNQARVLKQIYDLSQDAENGGFGIVLSTHDPDQAFALGADVVAMAHGRVVSSGAASRVLTGQLLSEIYETPVKVETTSSGRQICVLNEEFSGNDTSFV